MGPRLDFAGAGLAGEPIEEIIVAGRGYPAAADDVCGRACCVIAAGVPDDCGPMREELWPGNPVPHTPQKKKIFLESGRCRAGIEVLLQSATERCCQASRTVDACIRIVGCCGVFIAVKLCHDRQI
jgi:hypothetical protein